jgi:prevent-host-death family protein
MADLSMNQARMQLDTLIRRAASARERVTITDHGRPAAVLVNAQELADLEEALALAEYRIRKSAGEHYTIPHSEARQKLGVHPLNPVATDPRGTDPSAADPSRRPTA